VAGGLEDPRALAVFQKMLFALDKDRVWRLPLKGKAEVYVAADAFPTPPLSLRGLVIDPEGGFKGPTIYVSDAGDNSNKGGAIYKIAANKKATAVTDQKRWPELKRPGALVLDGQNHLLVVDTASGILYRLHLQNGKTEQVASGLGSADGMTWDKFGRLYISDSKTGKVFVIGRPGSAPVAMADGLQGPAGIGLDPTTMAILVAERKGGTVSAVTARVPGAEVDATPVPFEFVSVFPNLKWTGWQSETPTGKQIEFRPIVMAHANDGSNRLFVGTQHGVVHVFPNDQKADKTHVFLDIESKVTYLNNQNEEGFLGLTFHPQYKKNGEFFVFYTLKQGKNKHTNILSRFRVSKDDANRADPASEEVLLRFEHKNWNHDGGTICFGPDGYLYVTTGDGGGANDPDRNGQNLKSWLAKVLRIDVDKKDPGKPYAVPKDNPFVGRDDALPETWAYGLRNIWRMAFDSKTGALWAGDVGQNLHEEVDIIVKGGNYGWNLREGLHPFSPQGVGPRNDLIDPIWEYHHSVGLCIIGGAVYRGKQVPELDGHYIYGDYPSGKLWALRYDESAKRVVANRPLKSAGIPMLSFGEDQQGEMYMLATSFSGRGIYQLQRSK
jgi:glucose/arabinose dehydrogenase